MVKVGLIYTNLNADEYVNDYDPTINPTVINEYATAAFRYFHNQIKGKIR